MGYARISTIIESNPHFRLDDCLLSESRRRSPAGIWLRYSLFYVLISACYSFAILWLKSPMTKSWDYDKVGARLVGGGATLSHTYRPTDLHTHLMLYKYRQGNILIRMARLMHIPWASEQSRFFTPLPRALPYFDLNAQ